MHQMKGSCHLVYPRLYSSSTPTPKKLPILLFLGLFSVTGIATSPWVPIRSLRIILDAGLSHVDEIQLIPSCGTLLASQ